MMNCQPMKDRILVRRITEPGTSRIVIPEKYRQQTHIGIILAVGPGTFIDGKRVPLIVKPGDMIAWGRFTDWEFDKDNPWGIPAGSCLIQEADIIIKITEPRKVTMEPFVHNSMGVARTSGSLEDLYSDAH